MINKKINLLEEYPMLKEDAYELESFCPSNNFEVDINRKRKTILVLPGGAYAFCSFREAEPIALRLAGENINVFVLNYKVAPFQYPHPLIGAYAALAYIRNHADEYNVDVNKIAVMGFSAGGHLAASVSCYFDEDYYADYLNEKKENLVVNGCLLGYPVIRTDKYSHAESAANITQRDPKLMDYFAIENHVTEKFPKTFIWHTAKDSVVPVLNSLSLAEALDRNNVFFELHVFPVGEHGESLANEAVYGPANAEYLKTIQYNQQWIEQALHFIKNYL